jgi:hypothetical protein
MGVPFYTRPDSQPSVQDRGVKRRGDTMSWKQDWAKCSPIGVPRVRKLPRDSQREEEESALPLEACMVLATRLQREEPELLRFNGTRKDRVNCRVLKLLPPDLSCVLGEGVKISCSVYFLYHGLHKKKKRR